MKRLLAAPLVLLAVVCSLALAGCQGGPTAEELIRESLIQEFDELKGGVNDELLENMMKSADGSFETLGIDGKTFAGAYLNGFDYSIGDIAVNDGGDHATADVTVKAKSIKGIIKSFQSAFEAKLGEMDLTALSNEDELVKLGGELLMQATKDAELKESNIKLQYDLTGDTWTPDEDVFNAQIAKALMA